MPKKSGKPDGKPEAAAEAAAAEAAADDKKWAASRETFVAPGAQASPASTASKDVLEATKNVDIDARKEALQIAGLSGEMAQESKALEDKLGMLKDQLSDLRNSIKTFETEFDARLDACLQSILSYKIGADSDDAVSGSGAAPA